MERDLAKVLKHGNGSAMLHVPERFKMKWPEFGTKELGDTYALLFDHPGAKWGFDVGGNYAEHCKTIASYGGHIYVGMVNGERIVMPEPQGSMWYLDTRAELLL